MASELLTTKYRTLPRAYDLQQVKSYLRVLHRSPVPLTEIETRKLHSSVESGTASPGTIDLATDWKKKNGLPAYDESEYRYLLRDLGLIADRPLDPSVEDVLPLGGDGPPVGDFIRRQTRARMYHLTAMGEMTYDLLASGSPVFDSSLFWLILRNQNYLPLVQQIILDPKSYSNNNLAEIISTADSVSKNCVLHWLRYFDIASYISVYKLQVEKLARHLLIASVLEVNESFITEETYYVKEIDRTINERFSLNSSATNFCAALDIIFHYSKFSMLGYTSGREDRALPSFPNISMIKFIAKVPVSVGFDASEGEILKLVNYATGAKHG
jgi:hypothetical protein